MAFGNRNNIHFEAMSMLPANVGSVVQVDGLYYAGLSREDQSKKLLYCRQDTLDLLNALNGMEKGIRIAGPPGSGKSVTTWLWACHQAHVYGKNILWVHVRIGADSVVLLISSNQASMAVLGLDQIPSFVRSNQSDIVIIDGVTREPMHGICVGAVFNDASNHDRLSVSVASMATKTSPEQDRIAGISNFHAKPWSIEEFNDAVTNNDFFEQVEPFLLQTGDRRMGKRRGAKFRIKLISRKCYYSGYSARWTLGTSVSDVIEDIGYYLRGVPYYIGMLNGYVGEATEDYVYQLMHQYDGCRFFLSEYITKEVLRRGGPEAVRLAYNIIKLVNKPSLTDWVFVSDFIGQVIAAINGYLNVVGDSWDVSEVIEDCDMDSVETFLLYEQQLHEGCWLLPKRWNPGSYDLVSITCVDTLCDDGSMRKFVIHFIQVAKSSGNTLDLKHFEAFANCLMDALGCQITGIEIYIMTPDNDDFDTVSLMIKSTGRLASLNVGTTGEKWMTGNEESNVIIKQFVKTR
jgi:hypothetical protein